MTLTSCYYKSLPYCARKRFVLCTRLYHTGVSEVQKGMRDAFSGYMKVLKSLIFVIKKIFFKEFPNTQKIYEEVQKGIRCMIDAFLCYMKALKSLLFVIKKYFFKEFPNTETIYEECKEFLYNIGNTMFY